MSISNSELHNLTAGKRLLRNSVWNLLGDGAPFLVALVSIPRLVQALGTERFGMLTLVWLVIGYFNVFDLGLGRALTSLVAQHLGRGEKHSIGPLVWTGIILMLALGTAGAAVLAALSHLIVYSFLKVPPALQPEALKTFYLFSFSIPAVIMATAFRGVLEAHQRFSVAVAIRTPMSIYSFAAPLAVLPFSHSLVPVVGVLVVGRLVGLFAYAGICIASFPMLRPVLQWDSAAVRPLLNFGGWMTVSNVISPIMSELDRFLVGAILSLQAVAYYATPYDLVTKLTIIPGALAGVLFPAFSSTLVADPTRARRLYSQGIRLLVLVMSPIILIVLLLAKPGLNLWLGAGFANNSAVVLRILAIGIFLNGLTQIPFVMVQGAGHSKWVAKLHIIELPIYLAVFWVFTTKFGIVGTAFAWLLRAIVELVVLLVFGDKVLHGAFQDGDAIRMKTTAAENPTG